SIVADQMFEAGIVPSFDGGEKNSCIAEGARLRRRNPQGFRQFVAIVETHIGNEDITSFPPNERLAIEAILRQHSPQPPTERNITVRPLRAVMWTVHFLSREHPRAAFGSIGSAIGTPQPGKGRHFCSGVAIKPSARNSSSSSRTWRSQTSGSTLYVASNAAQ